MGRRITGLAIHVHSVNQLQEIWFQQGSSFQLYCFLSLYTRIYVTPFQTTFDLIRQTANIVHNSAVEIDEFLNEASAVANQRTIQLTNRNLSIRPTENHHSTRIELRTRAALLMRCSFFISSSTAGATRATLSYIDRQSFTNTSGRGNDCEAFQFQFVILDDLLPCQCDRYAARLS